MFFPREIHLRLRDQSLLKFNAGPQEVPADLPDEEKAILTRQGVKPIGQVSKEVITATEQAKGALPTDAEAVRAKALQDKAQAQSEGKTKELTSEEKAAEAKAAKEKAAADKAKAEADAKK